MLNLALARERSLLICTPSSRGPVPDYTVSAIRTTAALERAGIEYDFRLIVGWPLNQARNLMADYFLASSFTDMLFVDDDMGWEPQAVLRLMASNQPLIGGVGKKRHPYADNDLPGWCFGGLPGTEESIPEDGCGALEVLQVGTGFLRIRKEVFTVLAAAHPEWKRKDGYTFFDNDMDENGEELSEDNSFCRRYRTVGGKVWIDPAIRLRHWGLTEFSGDLAALFRMDQPFAG